MHTVVTKPVAFFHADPTNLRRVSDEQELRQLGASLLKKQLMPLIAKMNGMVMDGHRRLAAANLLGKETLDTFLVPDDVSDAEVKEIQLITQLHSAQLKPFELYRGCKEWLKHREGASAKELAWAIDMSESYVSKVLSLSRCIPAVVEAAARGKLGLSDWSAISKVGEVEQEILLAAKLNGASRDELESRGRRVRNGTKPAVRVTRMKCQMPSGVCVSFAGQGDGLSLDDVIQVLGELLKEARKANDQGLDSKTFAAVLRDKAKSGG